MLIREIVVPKLNTAHAPSLKYLLSAIEDASIPCHCEYTYTCDVELLLSNQFRARWSGLVNVVGVTQWPKLNAKETSRGVLRMMAEFSILLD